MFLSITAKRTLIVVLYLYRCFLITLSVRNNKCLRLIIVDEYLFRKALVFALTVSRPLCHVKIFIFQAVI